MVKSGGSSLRDLFRAVAGEPCCWTGISDMMTLFLGVIDGRLAGRLAVDSLWRGISDAGTGDGNAGWFMP